jgi:hypothetical protein
MRFYSVGATECHCKGRATLWIRKGRGVRGWTRPIVTRTAKTRANARRCSDSSGPTPHAGGLDLASLAPLPRGRPITQTRGGPEYPLGAGITGGEGKADERTRTADPFITSEVLYQLSYVGEAAR